ncbi:MAG: acyl-CoA thioesterase [Paenalcaligenes sp.]
MESKPYTQKHRIRFSECDPAGIVFYPQYFVMFNDLLEKWIDDIAPTIGFHGVIADRKVGLPTVHLDADFRAISKMGDDVILSLSIERLGGRSIQLHLQCTDLEGQLRMEINQVIVTTSLVTHKAIDIPEFLRTPMQAYVQKEAAVMDSAK